MIVIFEKKDIVRVFSKALGYDVREEDVTIKTEPFEIRIQRVDVDELAAQNETPPEEDDEDEDEVDPEAKKSVLTMTDILAANESMGGFPATTVHEENSELGRPLGETESLDPPEITPEENDAMKR